MKFAMDADDVQGNYADVKGDPGKLWEEITGVDRARSTTGRSSTYIARAAVLRRLHA